MLELIKVIAIEEGRMEQALQKLSGAKDRAVLKHDHSTHVNTRSFENAPYSIRSNLHSNFAKILLLLIEAHLALLARNGEATRRAFHHISSTTYFAPLLAQVTVLSFFPLLCSASSASIM